MQGVCNKIYDNANNIIGWDPNKGNNSIKRRKDVTEDVSEIGTGGGNMSKVEVKMVQSKHFSIPIHL